MQQDTIHQDLDEMLELVRNLPMRQHITCAERSKYFLTLPPECTKTNPVNIPENTPAQPGYPSENTTASPI